MNPVTRLPAHLVRLDETTALDPVDASAVRELVARVYLAEDSRDVDALRAVFTPDMVHEHTVFGRQHGIDAFIAMVAANPQGFDGFRHQALTVVTARFGDDGAEALSYILVIKTLDTVPA